MARYVKNVQAYAVEHGVSLDSPLWQPLERAVAAFKRAATSIAHLQQLGAELSVPAIGGLNRRLAIAERAFLDRRERFETSRHVLFRPAR